VLQLAQLRQIRGGVGLGHPHGRAVIVRDERPELPETGGDLVEDGQVARCRDLLIETGDAQRRRAPDRAGIGWRLP
jgi:hypothetical protein